MSEELTERKENVLWEPHPGKQTEALSRDEFEILYGGSRGGGKTAAGIAWIAEETDHPKYRALVLRRNSDDLKDWIDRASTLYEALGASKVGSPPEFHWPSGALIRTGHLNDDDAYTKYQGHEYHRILIEELTQIPTEKSYLKLLASCRSTIPELRPHIFSTTNPGEVGHAWVKARFIDAGAWGQTIWTSAKLTDGTRVWHSRIFIHATMDDNPTLMRNDPEYIASIEALKEVDPDTYYAWRYGDWDRFAGQVFKEWKKRTHVIPPVIPSKSNAHVLWMDWGYSESSAFACYLSAIVPMTTEDGQKYTQVVTYREWYGNQVNPKDWARKIYQDCMSIGIKPNYGVSDPATHAPLQSGDQSISSMFEDEWKRLHGQAWVTFKKGSNSGKNDRVGRVGMIHEWMSINPQSKLPYWVITENCINIIRITPLLVHDEHLVEAYDTKQEDHAMDASAYGLQKVKFSSVKPGVLNYRTAPQKQRTTYDKDFRELALDPKEFSRMYAEEGT